MSVKNRVKILEDINPYKRIVSFCILPSTKRGRTICIAKVMPLNMAASIPRVSRFAPLVENMSIIHIQPKIQVDTTIIFFRLILSLKNIYPNIVTHIGFENIRTVATDRGILDTAKL